MGKSKIFNILLLVFYIVINLGIIFSSRYLEELWMSYVYPYVNTYNVANLNFLFDLLVNILLRIILYIVVYAIQFIIICGLCSIIMVFIRKLFIKLSIKNMSSDNVNVIEENFFKRNVKFSYLLFVFILLSPSFSSYSHGIKAMWESTTVYYLYSNINDKPEMLSNFFTTMSGMFTGILYIILLIVGIVFIAFPSIYFSLRFSFIGQELIDKKRMFPTLGELISKNKKVRTNR